jgi:uncharacterized protein (TIGR01319 family)
MAKMKLTLLIDFGSTFTKVTAMDLEAEQVVATAMSSSTVDTDVMQGLSLAVKKLKDKIGLPQLPIARKIACSSAAGGLRMIAVGLVPSLTVEAASMAALSAGAKLVGVHAYELTASDLEEIQAKKPDVILLAGGTDGGNRDVIIHNAKVLAQSCLQVPIVMAGNKAAREKICGIFSGTGKDLRITANVLPAINELDIEPARQTIRGVFIDRIVHAKGIDKAAGYVDSILMPTPTAVMQAATLLAEGTADEPGLGDIVVVDIGGATTDVYSVCSGKSDRCDVIPRGLPEPYVKRTVEGDLGVRYNILSILEAVGPDKLAAKACLCPSYVLEKVRCWSRQTASVPTDSDEIALDHALAFFATEIATARHAGRVEPYYTPLGITYVQYGKDLTLVKTLIGTGGVLVKAECPQDMLRGALADPADPNRLKPKEPDIYVDRTYIMYAAGLLAETDPSPALRIMKKNLKCYN